MVSIIKIILKLEHCLPTCYNKGDMKMNQNEYILTNNTKNTVLSVPKRQKAAGSGKKLEQNVLLNQLGIQIY